MTRDDEETMKLRRAFAAPAESGIKIAGCPEPDRIWSAVRGELAPDEIRETVDHVGLCAACAEDWRIAMAFEEEARHRKMAPVVPIDRYRPWVAAAAAALVLTVAGVYIRESQQGTGTAGIYRGNENRIEATVAPGAALPREAFVVSWKPVETAKSYDLLITTDLLTVVANPKGLTSTSYTIPPEDLAKLPTGTQLHWTVTAFDEEGGTISHSRFINRLQ